MNKFNGQQLEDEQFKKLFDKLADQFKVNDEDTNQVKTTTVKLINSDLNPAMSDYYKRLNYIFDGFKVEISLIL